MDHEEKIQKLASDVHNLSAVLVALLVSFAALRQLALFDSQMARADERRDDHDHHLTAGPDRKSVV